MKSIRPVVDEILARVPKGWRVKINKEATHMMLLQVNQAYEGVDVANHPTCMRFKVERMTPSWAEIYILDLKYSDTACAVSGAELLKWMIALLSLN